MKKLIAIDLDGTALNNESKISARTAATLKRAAEKGHYVTIATGRPYRMSQHIYHELGLTTPMINFNGALVHLPNQTWDYETASFIQRDIAFEILAQKKALNLDFIAAENKETFYIDTFDFYDSNFFASKPDKKNLLSASNMKTDPTSLLLRVNNSDSETVLAQLISQFGEMVDINTWGGVNPMLELVAKGIHKAKGLAHVADVLNINQKDIIAFGDEHNDLDMLTYAGVGVAMANGTKEAQAVADTITEFTNDQDGVAAYLEEHLAI